MGPLEVACFFFQKDSEVKWKPPPKTSWHPSVKRLFLLAKRNSTFTDPYPQPFSASRRKPASRRCPRDPGGCVVAALRNMPSIRTTSPLGTANQNASEALRRHSIFEKEMRVRMRVEQKGSVMFSFFFGIGIFCAFVIWLLVNLFWRPFFWT